LVKRFGEASCGEAGRPRQLFLGMGQPAPSTAARSQGSAVSSPGVRQSHGAFNYSAQPLLTLQWC